MIRKLMNFQNIQLVWLMRWTLLLPGMPRDQAEADQLAPSHIAGPHHRAAISTAPLGSRWDVEGDVSSRLLEETKGRWLGERPLFHPAMSTRLLGQLYRALVPAACEGVRQVVICVCAAAASALIFAGAAGNLVGVFLEVGAFLPSFSDRVSSLLELPGAGPAALKTPIGHVFVFAYAVLGVLRRGGIVGDGNATASVFDQLVSLLRLVLVPLVGYAGESAHVVDSLSGVCCPVAWDA